MSMSHGDKQIPGHELTAFHCLATKSVKTLEQEICSCEDSEDDGCLLPENLARVNGKITTYQCTAYWLNELVKNTIRCRKTTDRKNDTHHDKDTIEIACQNVSEFNDEKKDGFFNGMLCRANWLALLLLKRTVCE